MNLFYFYSRLTHFLSAKHRNGHGIHSPMIYDFVRNVIGGNRRKDLIERIEDHYPQKKVHFAITPDNLSGSTEFISILGHTFNSRNQYIKWKRWRKKHPCHSIRLKNCIVIFWDPQLPNRHYKIRY